jgi:hypothetical protein
MASEFKTAKSPKSDKLSEGDLKAFSIAAKEKLSYQATYFLNAFWDEIGDQAEVIYCVHFEVFKQADMRAKGTQYIHLYEEGNDVDFDIGLYFFEQLVKYFDDDKNKAWKSNYPKAVPAMQTAIVRKQEIREKVDVNFDGRVSFLEFLLYQFNLSPKDLMSRKQGSNEALRLAQLALEDVSKKIREYEEKKRKLTEASQLNGGKGIKALAAINELAQLDSSPISEQLRALLIKAEAAVRLATKGGGKSEDGGRTDGSLWWLNRDLQSKKEKYGKKSS